MGENRRYHIIDTFRGLALISMLAYHFMYDWVYIFGHDSHWYSISSMRPWQQSIAWSFIIISGISFHFSRNSLKNGIKLVLWGLVITVVTYAFIPQQMVRFGVLSLIGMATIITYILEKPLSKVPGGVGIVLSLLLAFATWRITGGEFAGMMLPAELYETAYLYPLGFPGPNFRSTDYFPLLPWLFVFLAGYYLGKSLVIEGQLDYRGRENPLSILGRHTLPIYLLHQPVIYGILWLVYYFA